VKIKSGDIVLWRSPRHKCGYVPDKEGNPKKFVVVVPRRKYCERLRSLDHYLKGYSFQDLHDFDMSFLEPTGENVRGFPK